MGSAALSAAVLPALFFMAHRYRARSLAADAFAKLIEVDCLEQRESSPKPAALKNRYVLAAAVCVPLIFMFCVFALRMAPASAVLIFSAVAGAVYLIYQKIVRGRARQSLREIEFFLPLVMERLVMAAHAGLDIISAVRSVAAADPRPVEASDASSSEDRVTQLLREVCRYVDRGMTFEQSLQRVSDAVPSAALRHAFLHLCVAHREGGEVVMPLRELSNATQLYYQESVEEEIAKMPVKATMPLICTFTGLIICFLTSPLIQVMDILAKAKPPAMVQLGEP